MPQKQNDTHVPETIQASLSVSTNIEKKATEMTNQNRTQKWHIEETKPNT